MTDQRPAINPLRLAGEQPADYVRSVLDRAHEAFIAMDAGGFVIDWNRQAERTFGWTREEAVGRVLAHLIIPERDRDAHLRGLEHYIETGEAPIIDQRLELSAIDRAGRELAVEVTISADPTPDIPRFYAFLHDISERKRGERSLSSRMRRCRREISERRPVRRWAC